jgi:hypothetical protein
MAEITNLNERRRDDRHPVQNGGFVVLHPKQYFPKLGRMIDISLGGLAFQYHLENKIRLKEFTAVDIYFSGEGLCIGNIPVESVWSIQIPRQDPYFNITVKRYGVAFGSLSPDDVIQLNQFIREYTIPT